MASKRVGRNAEEQALFDYQDAGSDFLGGGAASYDVGNPYEYTKLGSLDQLGPSSYDNIETDPAYKAHELEALSQLEEQSKNGYSARDKADLARIEQSANRANQGRQGAIRQNMAARGIGGGGLDVVLQQQAAQDANEQEALAGLEKNAQMQDRKMQATSQLGQLSNQLQSRDFSQQAQRAQAQDSISKFNTQNSNQVQMQNNQGLNSANQTNNERRNQVNDNNVNAGYTYRKDAMGVGQGNAQMANSYATEMYNREQAKKAAKAAKKSGQKAAIGSAFGAVAGGVIGSFVAPGVGTAAGATMGASLGGAAGGAFAHGGRIEGPEVSPFDDPSNDIIPINVSAGEVVLPKSVASDPNKAAMFVAQENSKQSINPMLLQSLAKKNPELVAKYQAQMGEGQQGLKDAQQAQDYGTYANMASKVITDFGNSQKNDTIVHNDWMRNGGKPTEVIKAERKEYDGSAIDALGKQGVSRAQSKLDAMKSQMKDDYMMQRDQDKDAFDQTKFQAESDARANKATADANQFGVTSDLHSKTLDETIRNHKAMEAATMQRNTLDRDLKIKDRTEKQNRLNIPGYNRTGEVTPTDTEAVNARDAVGTLNSFKAGMGQFQDLVKKNGSFEWGGQKGNEMEALSGDLRMQAKSLYELGVLNGQDYKLILQQIPDTTSMSALFSNNKSVGKTLETTTSSIDRQVQEKLKAKGYAPKSEMKDKPSSVIQNGHTYTLNPQTGEYE